jgi:hypothetical protein
MNRTELDHSLAYLEFHNWRAGHQDPRQSPNELYYCPKDTLIIPLLDVCPPIPIPTPPTPPLPITHHPTLNPLLATQYTYLPTPRIPMNPPPRLNGVSQPRLASTTHLLTASQLAVRFLLCKLLHLHIGYRTLLTAFSRGLET